MKDHVLDNVPIDQQSLAHYVDDKDIANPKFSSTNWLLPVLHILLPVLNFQHEFSKIPR